MPSSPPPYNTEHVSLEVKVSLEERSLEQVDTQQPRAAKYNLLDMDGSEFSSNDLSRSSNFRPVAAISQKDDSRTYSESVSSLSDALPHPKDPGNGAVRIVSGQSDIRNEGLSPIYISHHDTVGEGVNHAALHLSADELQSRLKDIQTKNQRRHIDDLSQLPEDNTVDIDDYAHNGRFINLQRGGYSKEGSFRNRMLSPSSPQTIEESVLLPEGSMQASTPKQLPNMRKTRTSNDFAGSPPTQISHPLPPAPHPSPVKSDEADPKSSTGSPLKIFGAYDTFTNQKLLRRLSQFEEHFDNHEEEIPSASLQEATYSGLDEAFVEISSPEKELHHHGERQNTSRKLNSFGRGDLDDFQFNEEISCNSSRPNSEDDDNEDDDKENVPLPELDRTTHSKFKFQLEPSPVLEEGVISQRRTKHANITSTKVRTVTIRKTARPATSSSNSSSLPPAQRQEDLETPRKRDGNSEGKRLFQSPSKDPTPKRRRTLQKSDSTRVADEDVEADVSRDSNHRIHSLIGKKRKDAKHGDDLQTANPKVLATRQILRPRTPTPTQRSSLRFERARQEVNLDSAQDSTKLREEKIARIQAELDSTDLRKPLAALGMSQQAQDGSRKGSVTTQDFLDEAKKIMAGIRGKARPRSGLNSLEESESDNDQKVSTGTTAQEEEFEDSYQESTQEPFSRPPSRDGRPIERPPVKQLDPELLDHLRKYEEMSDMDGVIASSIKSIAMAKDAANSAKEINRIMEEAISRGPRSLLSQGNVIESDPPNIRITENPELQRKRKHSTSSAPSQSGGSHEVEFGSQGSNASSNQSTSRSIATGSSRGSDSRRVIAPHTVSHLIPEQLAGMVFDRDRNIWVKRKPANGEQERQNPLRPDETDEDPFGGIPDLSVDEIQELQGLKAAAKREEEERAGQIHNDEGTQAISNKAAISGLRHIPHSVGVNAGSEDEPSSEPSKFTQLASSITNPETNTRITSWGDERRPLHQASKSAIRQAEKLSKIEAREEFMEEVEKEISIYEDRVQASSPQRRSVTISFSSPLASIIQTCAFDDNPHFEHELDDANQADNDDYEDFRIGDVVLTKRRSASTSSMKVESAFRSSSRRLSLGGRGFLTRPVSRIDEQDEESLNGDIDEQRRRSVSMVVATPLPPRAAARPPHEIGTLELTPLSDFTVHHGNESFGLEVSYIERGQRYTLGGDNKRALSLSIKDIVARLTEVEPYEPFWEHIKEMDLKGKKLTNLHKLNEFCGRLEELDVSDNQISQLNGAPQTIRQLRITHNYLSDLTAWGHLSNLQYIDVSNNEIESLSAFKYLIHLRGLRADNNKIKSLEGIGSLDGLLSLRLRGNLIESVDFKDTKLQRLSDLDLNGNRIRDIQNIHLLSSLSSLSLEDNEISTIESNRSQQQWALKYLKLGGNILESIDVSQYPNLRLLYLDRNRLGKVTGLSRTKHLDSLSMREQQDGSTIDHSFLAEAFEVRKLFLSGNFLGVFEPPVDFLNLQYLELANCGLESLPVDFGQMFPNIRVLNLNFNALNDIRPLLGIVRLKKLHLAGNRILKSRTTTDILAQFPTLTQVDLRSNPLTQGFYPPVVETRLVHRNDGEPNDAISELFSLGPADAEKDKKYASRLDMETKMLRRVYQMLVLGRSERVKVLDGLHVDVSIAVAKDAIFDALVRAGIVQADPPEAVEETSQVEEEAKDERDMDVSNPKQPLMEAWQVEDSFA
jgi:Leucine-rich repeat (LRR) protein